MTTIAANDKCMAADSFFSDGTSGQKILRGRSMLVGYAGSVYYGLLLARWVIDGMRGPAPEPRRDGDELLEADLLILTLDGLFTMDRHGVMLPVDDYAAIGSGAGEAHGAMAVGATPEAAVHAAIKHDSQTKGPVVIEWLRRKRN